MRLGDKVLIKECHKVPELVDQEAVIMAVADQELAKYPVTVKLTSGEHEGKFCDFREDELDVIPGIPKAFLEE